MTTTADRINQQLTDEAQSKLRTRIDLDAFLALKPEQRAARWRQWDLAAKHDVIVQQLGRLGCDWDAETLAKWVAKYDAKWGEEPTITERAVCAALERLAEEQERTARLSGEAQPFGRAATAYRNAALYYRDGVRPQLLEGGRWRVARQGGGEHLITVRPGEMPICSCRAADAMHWPIALIIGLEVAGDDLDRFDGGDREPQSDEPPPPAGSHESYLAITRRRRARGLDVCGWLLGTRIAKARRVRYQEAA